MTQKACVCLMHLRLFQSHTHWKGTLCHNHNPCPSIYSAVAVDEALEAVLILPGVHASLSPSRCIIDSHWVPEQLYLFLVVTSAFSFSFFMDSSMFAVCMVRVLPEHSGMHFHFHFCQRNCDNNIHASWKHWKNWVFLLFIPDICYCWTAGMVLPYSLKDIK